MSIRARNALLALLLGSFVAAPGLLAGACSATGQNVFLTGGGGAGGSNPDTVSSSTGDGGGFMFDAGHPDGSGAGGGVGGGGGTGGDPQTCAEAAAYRTYIGCDFWPTVVANNVWSIFDYAVVVANAGSQTASVTVTRNGQTAGSAMVEPNGLATIYLPWVPSLKGLDADSCGSATPLSNTVRATGGAYHLVSTVPVTVYQFNALEYAGQGGPPGKDWSSCPGNQLCDFSLEPVGCFSFTNDASLLLPSTAMTGNYRVTGQHGWALANMGSYFAVTGTQNNTMVTVYVAPGGHILGGGGIPDTQGGGVINFSLNAGDVVELVGDPKSDLSGSLVKATAAVQVITGVPCIYQPQDQGACDHIEESVFPAETLGRHYFVTIPTGPNGNVVGHIVRIFGNVDDTHLSYPSGNPGGAPYTIDAGQVVDLGVVSKDFEIVGDHEYAVGSFMLGASLLDPGNGGIMQKGDPSMSMSTSVEQFRTKYVFLAPSDYDISFVDVVQPLGAQVQVDGTAIAPPQAIGSSFGVSRVHLGPGNGGAHVLVSNLPVGIQVMGYGSFTSYQYPGGLNLNTIAPPPPPPVK